MGLDRGRRGRPAPAPQPGAAGEDATLLALENLVHAAERMADAVALVTTRAAHIRACRSRGSSYREIVNEEDQPLIAELLTDTIQRFEAAGTRFRQAEARALHEEGMTMEQIAGLFGLTRQRVSALLRTANTPVRTERPE